MEIIIISIIEIVIINCITFTLNFFSSYKQRMRWKFFFNFKLEAYIEPDLVHFPENIY